MNRNLLIIIGGVFGTSLLVVLIYGLFFASNPKEIPSAQIGKKAKPFTVTTFHGTRTITLDSLKGKPVVLNFWASWCVACRAEAHILEQAHRKYTPQGVVFLGIAINDTRRASLDFIARYGKTYLLAPDDELGSVSLDYGVTAVPETFFIDREGVIVEKILGAVDRQRIERFIHDQL